MEGEYVVLFKLVLGILKCKSNATIYVLVFFYIAHTCKDIFESKFYVSTQWVMICNKWDLIACFHSDVNVTFF